MQRGIGKAVGRVRRGRETSSMGTSSHLCRARAVHVGVSPEWGALSARPRADAARVAASFWPSPAVSYSRTIRAMFGTACLSRSSRFAISSSLAGSPARTPRDGWNHRYQACRRNPTHDPCWHSAASSVIIFSHRLRCSDITCSRVIHATETAIGDRGLGLLTIMR